MAGTMAPTVRSGVTAISHLRGTHTLSRTASWSWISTNFPPTGQS
jgi:hypothetical protein